MAKLGKRVFIAASILLICIFLGVLLFSANKGIKRASAERFYSTNQVADVAGMGPRIPLNSDGPLMNDVNAPKRANSVASMAPAAPDAAAGMGLGFAPSDPEAPSFNPVGAGGKIEGFQDASCFPKDRLTAQDLLPKDAANSKWAQMNPAGQGDVGDQNYLTAGHHIGINSVGSSKKNANLQLRSDPIAPQVVVSPWLQSTIEPDLLRKPFEIGA